MAGLGQRRARPELEPRRQRTLLRGPRLFDLRRARERRGGRAAIWRSANLGKQLVRAHYPLPGQPRRQENPALPRLPAGQRLRHSGYELRRWIEEVSDTTSQLDQLPLVAALCLLLGDGQAGSRLARTLIRHYFPSANATYTPPDFDFRSLPPPAAITTNCRPSTS